MFIKPLPTRERLYELLEYYPESGDFVWKSTISGHIKGGYQAGSLDKGYITIQIDGLKFKAHRLAWLFVYGSNPLDLIDHVNGVTSDNRISNLRLCNHSQNIANSRVSKNSKSGIKGVYLHSSGKKWAAEVCIHRKKIHLGCFESQKEAQAAYAVASQKFHKEFSRLT